MTITDTHVAGTIRRTRRRSLLGEAMIWNRAFIEHGRLRKLDAMALEDMGLSETDRDGVTIGEIAARIRRQDG